MNKIDLAIDFIETLYFNVELKPCPFCGGDADFYVVNECHGHGDYIDEYYVGCNRCGCQSVHVDCYDNTKEQAKLKAAERWNRRVCNE